MHLTLLAVPGCPNLAVLEDRLAGVLASVPPVTVSRRLIADEGAAVRWGMHGSPTLLVDGVDPFAAPGQRASLSCRLYLDENGRPADVPSQAQIRRALVEAAQANRFTDRLRAGWSAGRYACVGLDPDRAQLLATTRSGEMHERILEFGRAIVDATSDLVVAYKPNSAFYEQFGPAGMGALRDLIGYIHQAAPGVVVILDAKRGDIEHTNEAYASALFDVYDADAVTVQPYLGAAALAPFFDRLDRGVIVLCRTSNPGGGELQDRELQDRAGGRVPLYQRVAELAQTSWNRNGNCGLLVGATYPRELGEVRALAPTLPLLIAGVGRQLGAVREAFTAGRNAEGGVIVSSSRAVTHASSGPDFAEAARRATLALHEQLTAWSSQ